MSKLHETLKELSLSLKFDLNDEELEIIANEFEEIVNGISNIGSINLKDVVATNFIEPIRLSNQLFDDNYQEYNQEEVFKNSNFFKDGMVVIKNEK